MKIISEIIAGSHLYGLSTEDSDLDKRGVFLNTEYSKILGLERFENFKQTKDDTIYFELVHFLRGLSKTNTQMLELLFAEEKYFSILEKEFKTIQENKYELIDSDYLYKSLLGYIHNEKRLANGERTGNLGSIRKQKVEKYGFSPKNFSHLFRLSYCGKVFFETDHYPVCIRDYDNKLSDFIFSVKTEPEKYNKEYLNIMVEKSIQSLEVAYKNKKTNFSFNYKLANELCKNFYLPFLI